MEFRVLGPFEVINDGRLVTPSAPKLHRVLALLAVRANNVVRVDQLIDELWDERPPPSATTTLQTYVYHLRKQLGLAERGPHPGSVVDSAALYTCLGGYLLSVPPQQLDAHRFDELANRGWAELERGALQAAVELFQAALRLWRGPALAGVAAGPVLQADVLQLEESRKSILEQRLDAELALGRHHQLVGELTGLVAAQPTHEGFCAKLMLALHRAGRRSEALQAFRRLHRVLATELGVQPSAELQRLHGKVLAADPELEHGARGAPVLAAARPEPPAQLPPDLDNVVGRARELDQLERHLTSQRRQAPAVALVTGAPGAGKSAFAVHLAHRIRGAFPDGQLYGSLAGSAQAPADPAQVLAGFLRAAGNPVDHTTVGLAELSARLRSWTADRRVLMVLDDMPGIELLEPLLPAGRGCAVIVCSRRRLAGHAITAALDLPPLTKDDAMRLLAGTLIGPRMRDCPDAAHRLVALCGGLPLALRAVATRLALRPHWPLAHAVDRLQHERHWFCDAGAGELDVRASVEASWRLMPTAYRAAFLRLATQDRSVCRRRAAAVLGVDERNAEAILEGLVEFALAEVDTAEPDGAGGFRYRFPALLRMVANTLDAEPAAPRPSPIPA